MVRIESAHGEYADDNMMWKRGKTLYTIVREIQKDIDKIQNWCNTWNAKIQPSKTEYIVFQPPRVPRVRITLKMGDKPLVEAEGKRLMGVQVDRTLHMRTHAEQQVKKAYRTLKAVSGVIDPRRGVDQGTAEHINKTPIRSHIEFGAALLATDNSAASKMLDKVQRQALLKITGCLSHTATEALEMITNVQPTDLFLLECKAKEYARLLAKKAHLPLGEMLNKWRARKEVERTPTTLTLLENYYKQAMREKSTAPVEEEHQFDLEVPVFQPVIRGKLFDLQKTMSKKDGVENVKQLIGTSTTEDILRFTDGSALGNPGPTGCGAAVYLNGIESTPICLKKAVASSGNNYLGK
ncbi:hypothetical protein Bbelb_025410 [Branchiostoma belcheri]|nr:hypothetical protein Bbelb_025410 [Branchiostoma belcheri]